MRLYLAENSFRKPMEQDLKIILGEGSCKFVGHLWLFLNKYLLIGLRMGVRVH